MSLQIKNLNKKFEDLQVLSDVSFEVNKHDIVAIMGPSGVGKSTLLRCICGLEKMDSGSIIVDDENSDNDSSKNKIGFVFQNYNLFPHRTVFQNCVDSLLMQKEDRKIAEEKVLRYLRMLSIEDKKEAYPYQLSGGQKQRVAIARACVLSPSYLCFDEPTSALDEKSVFEVISLIQNLAKEELGILVVTHDKTFAQKVSTSIITLK